MAHWKIQLVSCLTNVSGVLIRTASRSKDVDSEGLGA